MNSDAVRSLKQIITELHSDPNADRDELTKRFAKVASRVSSVEIAQAEQEAIQEGVSPESIRKLCDVHLDMFVDDAPETSAGFGIRSIPTIMFFRDGEPEFEMVGMVPKPVLERWLRRTARQIITDRVTELSRKIGLQPGKVYIGERISRWGSCSGRGNLSFCYRLVMAPLPVIDAVIAHELCHLRHLNHSRRFYRLLRLACPDYRRQMDWLHEHEDDLQL